MAFQLTRTLVFRLMAVVALYVLTARLGLMLDPVQGFAALVWAPSGIALAAVLLYGTQMWPAIAVGALIVNVWIGAPVPVAVAIAAGNTAEALVGAWALRRVPGFRVQMDRLTAVLALLGLAGVLSTLVAATIGVTSLVLGGVVPSSAAAATFRAWWLGDMIGIVLLTPALLAWHSNRRIVKHPRRLAETALLTVAILVVGSVTYLRVVPLAPGASIPVLIWAALRFGPRGASTAALLVAVIAIGATVSGTGPFVRPTLHDSLSALQLFLGIMSSTFLVLSASFAERRKAEHEARRAEARAARANAAKGEFLAVMSHELRTPLNAISGYVDLMIAEVQGPLTPKQRDALTRIKHNGQHLLSLIEDVLTFARIEAGRVAVDTRVVRLDDVLDSLEPLVLPALEKKRLHFVREKRDGDLFVCADPEKLRQILENVISNAVKYTPEDREIRISAERHGPVLKLQVRDTGMGIPTDKLARVFEPFYQVDRGTTRRYPGVGLGLSISRDLARAMGGDVRIESTEGVGTTVHIVLPAAEQPVAARAPAAVHS